MPAGSRREPIASGSQSPRPPIPACTAPALLSVSGGGAGSGGDVSEQSGQPAPGRDGAGGDEQIYQPGEPRRLPAPDGGAAGHRHVLHRLVLRLRGDFDQVHAGHLQGAVDLLGGFALHGLRRPLPAAVGRDLRLRPGSTGTALRIPHGCKLPRVLPLYHVQRP